MFTNHGSKFTFWPKGPGKMFQNIGKLGLRAGQKKGQAKKARQIRANKVYCTVFILHASLHVTPSNGTVIVLLII